MAVAGLAAALRDPQRARWLRAGAIALGAAAIAWAFAFAVLRHTWPMGLPLDDSYRSLTSARQIGRGQLPAGAIGPLWPIVLAPLWALGARGHALVWAAFVVSAGLYAATALAAARAVRTIAGAGGGLAAVLVLAVPAFAWAALSGTEVALTAALTVGPLALLVTAPAGPPSAMLVACLAAVTLTRPEAAVIAIAVAGAAGIGRVRRRELAAAARWLAALAPLALGLGVHRGLTGRWLPSSVLATSPFAQPGFDAASGWRAAVALTARMARGVFWSADSPLVWPRAIAALWLVGAVRVAAWARRERRVLAGAAVLGAPVIVLLAVIASSGMWELHNHRGIAPAFPLIAITAGVALVPSPHGSPRWRRLHAIAAAVGVAGYAVAAVPRMVADARLFAQGVADTNAQGVTIGEYLHRKLPGATVVAHDAGAIAYYSDGPVHDLDGGGTDEAAGVAGVAGHGPGAQFERLERLAERRFSHFAVYPGRIGTAEFFGEDLYHTPLGPRLDPRSLGSDRDLQLIAACWDHAGSGERPLRDHPGWAIVDRIDVADLDSEAAHDWSGALGPREVGDPATRWSFVGREAGAHGLVLDGGRTIRGGAERFAIAIDPGRPVQLVLRSGGARTYFDQEPIQRAVSLRILDDAGRELARASLPPPDGSFVEVGFAIPAGALPAQARLHSEAAAPYRAFHWFVLQPE